MKISKLKKGDKILQTHRKKVIERIEEKIQNFTFNGYPQNARERREADKMYRWRTQEERNLKRIKEEEGKDEKTIRRIWNANFVVESEAEKKEKKEKAEQRAKKQREKIRQQIIDEIVGEVGEEDAEELADALINNGDIGGRTYKEWRSAEGELSTLRACEIASNCQHRHEQTDYDDLLKGGMDKETAREWSN